MKPPDGMNYYEYLRSPWWEFIRRSAMERAYHACEVCHERRAKAVHHWTYERVGCELPDDVIAVCHPCHAAIHDLPVPPQDDRLGEGWREWGLTLGNVFRCGMGQRQRSEREVIAPMPENDREATEEERNRAIAYWREEARLRMRDGGRESLGPLEPPMLKLARLERTIWNEPLMVGSELGAKLDAIAARIRATGKAEP